MRPDGIFVTRSPGPSKTLDPTPRRMEDLADMVTAANDWSVPHSFLYRLAYARSVDGVYTSLRDGVLTRYLAGGAEQSRLEPEEIPAALRDVFGADPALYVEAARVRRKYAAPSG